MNNLVASIDIGTSKVCAMVGKVNSLNELVVLGKGYSPCSALKKGIIVDIDATAEAIRASIEQVEAEANLKIHSAYVNIIGAHVSVINNHADINISNDTREISSKDVDKLLYAVKEVSIPEDRQIIDIIPRHFIIDGYDEIVEPIGMVGVKFEVDADVVAGKITSVQNIVKSMERANLKIDGIVVEALSTGEHVLSSDERDMGVILLDIGGGVTDISVFKNKKLLYYNTIPVGGDHITNDISIGLKISYNECEKIKRQYELALTSLIKNDQEVPVYDGIDNKKRSIKVSEVVEIIEARVFEIFSLAKDMLENSDIYEALPAGIVLTGGGISYVDGGIQLANEVFELPVRIAPYKTNSISKVEFAVVAGMIKYVSNKQKGLDFASEVKAMRPKKLQEPEKKEFGLFKFISKIFKELF